MAFRFRFNTLLKQRHHLFDTARHDLAAARRKVEELQGRRHYVKRAILGQHRVIEEKCAKGISAAQHLSYIDYLHYLERQMANLDLEVQKAAEDVEEKKSVLLEREKAVRMLESLEEKDRQAYRYCELIEERKRIDEVSIFKNFAGKEESRENEYERKPA